MVSILARQSVQKKMDLRQSKLLGNYEYYYGAGLLTAALGLSLGSDCSPSDITQAVKGASEKVDDDRPRLKYLAVIMEGYYCSDERDDQMTELFEMGMADAGIPENL